MERAKTEAWMFDTTKGGVENNLYLTERPVPALKKDEILIEVLNVALNPADLNAPDLPIFGRWVVGRPATPSFDFCGRIRQLSSDFTQDSRGLHVDQVVFGKRDSDFGQGAMRKVLTVHKDSVYPLPATIPTEHGSAMGIAALTAYQSLAPYAKPGAKVLITGGSGGVGTFGIQIAKALGYYVITTCSSAGAQLCKDLGADEVLDYKASTFAADLCRTQVDLIADYPGLDPSLHRRSEAFLKPDGRFILIGLMNYSWEGRFSMLSSWLRPAWLGGPKRRWKYMLANNNVVDFAAYSKIAEEGKMKVVVDSIFPFQRAPEAYQKMASGRAKGKIIVNVGE